MCYLKQVFLPENSGKVVIKRAPENVVAAVADTQLQWRSVDLTGGMFSIGLSY